VRLSSQTNPSFVQKAIRGGKARYVLFITPQFYVASLPGVDRSVASQDVEMEDLNFYYANYSRIYNDVITLRKGSSYM
jgi:hypothetical protein